METVSAQVASSPEAYRASKARVNTSGRLGAFYHDQIIVLALEAGC